MISQVYLIFKAVYMILSDILDKNSFSTQIDRLKKGAGKARRKSLTELAKLQKTEADLMPKKSKRLVVHYRKKANQQKAKHKIEKFITVC